MEPLISEDFEPRASAMAVDKPVTASKATTAAKTVTAENTSSGTAPDQRFLCQHRLCTIYYVFSNPISVSTVPGNKRRTYVSAWVRLLSTIN